MKRNLIIATVITLNIFTWVFLFYIFFPDRSFVSRHTFDTQFVSASTTPSETTNPAISSEQEVAASSTPKSELSVSKPITKKKVVDPQATSPSPITPPAPTPETKSTEQAPDFAVINENARKSIVNILCETKAGGTLNPITATGVVIDSRGIILTNAHVAQYFLLKDFQTKNFVQCTIRTGSPAYPRYHAELIYISPAWVEDNKTILKDADPKGTGEHDFALLRITDSIDGTPLPNFPHLTLKTGEGSEKGEPVDLVAYPAGFLGGLSILQDLNLTSALTTIQDVFTFSKNTIDLISVPGTILSQKGASGGAVVNKNGSLIGIITTSSNASTTGERDLRAITIPYINRALQSETGKNLQDFLSQDLAIVAQNFATNFTPQLSKLIEDELLK